MNEDQKVGTGKELVKQLNLIRMALNDIIIDVSKTKLYSYDGDPRHRWIISYSVYDPNVKKLVRRSIKFKKPYDPVERLKFAKEKMKRLNRQLSLGYCLPLKPTNEKSIQSAFEDIYKISSVRYSDSSAVSISFEYRDFLNYLKLESIIRSQQDAFLFSYFITFY